MSKYLAVLERLQWNGIESNLTQNCDGVGDHGGSSTNVAGEIKKHKHPLNGDRTIEVYCPTRHARHAFELLLLMLKLKLKMLKEG